MRGFVPPWVTLLSHCVGAEEDPKLQQSNPSPAGMRPRGQGQA